MPTERQGETSGTHTGLSRSGTDGTAGMSWSGTDGTAGSAGQVPTERQGETSGTHTGLSRSGADGTAGSAGQVPTERQGEQTANITRNEQGNNNPAPMWCTDHALKEGGDCQFIECRCVRSAAAQEQPRPLPHTPARHISQC